MGGGISNVVYVAVRAIAKCGAGRQCVFGNGSSGILERTLELSVFKISIGIVEPAFHLIFDNPGGGLKKTVCSVVFIAPNRRTLCQKITTTLDKRSD